MRAHRDSGQTRVSADLAAPNQQRSADVTNLDSGSH